MHSISDFIYVHITGLRKKNKVAQVLNSHEIEFMKGVSGENIDIYLTACLLQTLIDVVQVCKFQAYRVVSNYHVQSRKRPLCGYFSGVLAHVIASLHLEKRLQKFQKKEVTLCLFQIQMTKSLFRIGKSSYPWYSLFNVINRKCTEFGI